MESLNFFTNRVLPFKTSLKKNNQTKNYDVYGIRIPLKESQNLQNPGDSFIYLNFMSNLNQLYWDSKSAYATVDSFE